MVDLKALKTGLHVWSPLAELKIIEKVRSEIITFSNDQRVAHPSQITQDFFTDEYDAIRFALDRKMTEQDEIGVQVEQLAQRAWKLDQDKMQALNLRILELEEQIYGHPDLPGNNN